MAKSLQIFTSHTLEKFEKQVIIIVAVKNTAFLFIIKNGKGRRGPFHSSVFITKIINSFLKINFYQPD